jgi:hypothetical protein
MLIFVLRSCVRSAHRRRNHSRARFRFKRLTARQECACACPFEDDPTIARLRCRKTRPPKSTLRGILIGGVSNFTSEALSGFASRFMHTRGRACGNALSPRSRACNRCAPLSRRSRERPPAFGGTARRRRPRGWGPNSKGPTSQPVAGASRPAAERACSNSRSFDRKTRGS